MNFTREPIIETIIAPKEGHKLLVRNSKGGTAEEYCVDAVEVVSFGHAFFFRSLERPKAFIVPVTDYEIVEVKETRIALKNVSHERNIKIGGGKEARQPPREQPQREPEPVSAEEVVNADEAALQSAVGARMDKRRDKRRHRRRRGGDDKRDEQAAPASGSTEPADSPAPESAPLFSTLIPPPTTLIAHTMGKLKAKEGIEESPDNLPEDLKIADEKLELFSHGAPEEKNPEKPSDNTEGSSLQRTTTKSSFFKAFTGGSDFFL